VKEAVWTSLGLQPASFAEKILETERQYTVEYGSTPRECGRIALLPSKCVNYDRRNGIGSRTPGAYAPDDLLFFQEVANQICDVGREYAGLRGDRRNSRPGCRRRTYTSRRKSAKSTISKRL